MTAIEKSSNQIECLGHGVGHTVSEMFEMFKRVNHDALYQDTDTPILRKIGPRRKGDVESSVLSNVSSYMKNLYSFEDLLKV
jgi:UDP-glucose 4-epimerase